MADYVAPLSWAVIGSQAYADVYSYKRPNPSAYAAQERLQRLLTNAFQQHHMCLGPEWTTNGLAFAHVPSTSGRRPHALGELVNRFVPPAIPLIEVEYLGDPAEGQNARRTLRPDLWRLSGGTVQGLDRVVIIDDSWVTGGHAQSVASALKREGVPTVGVVTFARVLRTDWGDTAAYLHQHPPNPFDSAICPVHRTRH